MKTTYTTVALIEAATLEYGVYWINVEPDTICHINIPAGELHRTYGIRCNSDWDGDITLIVSGDGEGSANVERSGDGEGYAIGRRGGDGRGNVIVSRNGGGYGYAIATRDDNGAGYALANKGGDGAGNAIANRNGDGAGSAYASRDGDGKGNSTAYRYGNGEGNAYATRYGDGAGSAIAYRYGAGAGCATETDSCSTRRTVAHPGIVHPCLSGDGYLRVGCEVHTLSDWISDAEEIDARHGDGIAELTRALAESLGEEAIQ